MELTYHAEKRLYVFTTSRQEQDGHGKFGTQLAGEAKLKLLGYNAEKLTFATQDPFRALMLAKFGDAVLLKRIQEHARLKGNELPVLTHRNGVYIWTGPAMSADGKIRFRDIPKAAQFAFTKHPVRDIPRGAGEGCPSDVWWSESSLKAMKCSEYADEAAQLAIGTFIARKHNALQESRAVDADIDIPVPEGLEPKPFQRGGVAYAMKRIKVLFGDEPGLGKTIESTLWINCVPEVKTVLVVCPASLKLNWFAELQRWLVRPTTIGLVDSSRAQAVPDTDVVIVNYEQMAKRIDTGLKIKNKKTGEFKIKYDYVLREGLRKHWDMLIVDECHKLKGNPRDVIRTRMVFAISAHREAWLSGTPLVNRVRELWNIVHRLAPRQFPDETAYLNRYCAGGSFHDKYGGGQNLAELQEKMRVFFMIRRLKKDVLTELPLKTRQIIELPADGCRELLKQEALAFARKEEILTKQRLAVELAKASDSVEEYKRAVGALTKGIQVAFEDISRIRRETAIAKVPAVVEHVAGLLSEGQKVILFAYHQEVVEKLHEAFKNESVFMHGGTPTALRQVAVDKFQKEDKYRLITGTIGAMGVGYTLVASSYVVMAELDWVPGNVTQAEDRAHRIGQHDNVLVQHLVLQGSLDKRMADVIVEKQDMADRALDIESAAQLNLEPVMPERESVATQGVSQSDVAKLAEKLTADEIFAVHLSLKVLAGTHPQSRLIQGVTFREVDSALGRVLAEYGRLTPRLAALGYKFLGKYRNTALALLPEFQSLFERKKK